MQIPIYKRQVSTPRPSRVYPKVPAGLERALASQERKTRAKERGWNFLGNIASKLVGQVMKVESDTQYNRAVTETQKATNEFLMQLEGSQLTVKPSEGLGIDETRLKSPDFLGFGERYKEFSEQAREAALEKVTMPGLKKVVGSKLDSMFAAADIKVQEIQRRKVLENGRAELNKDIEFYVKKSRSVADLRRRVNGAADLEYISHDDAERVISDGTRDINTSNALDDAMAMSQTAGIDAATSMLLSDEAGTRYGLTYDERVSVATRARTAWGLENKQRLEAEQKLSQDSYWQAYKDIQAKESILTDINQLDDESLYPGLTTAQKVQLNKDMKTRANAGFKLEEARRDAEMEAAFSAVRIGLGDVVRGARTVEDIQEAIQDFVNQFPEYGDEIDKLTDQFATLDVAGEKKQEMLYKSDLTTELADHYKDRTLTPAIIDKVAAEVKDYEWGGEFVEHWTMRLDQMRNAIEKDAKEAQEKSAWETTGQGYRNIYTDKFIQLSKGEITLEQGRLWLEDNKGPGLDGEPRIGNKDFMKWWEKMEKIQDDPPYLSAAIAGIAKTYDAEIRELDDPDEIGKLEEEKENMIYKFRDDVIKNKWDAQQMSIVREIIENPIKERTGNAKARRFWQSTGIFSLFVKPPEEQMAEWAQQGWLDEQGRIIGKSDEEQLKLMGIDSFDELKWKGNLKKQYEETGLKIANITTESTRSFTYLLNTEGQPLMARNPAGEMVMKVMIDGEIKWIKTSELQ